MKRAFMTFKKLHILKSQIQFSYFFLGCNFSYTFLIKDEAEEIQKKKEKLIQLQQKRKEEQEKKRQYKEIEMSRRKDQER